MKFSMPIKKPKFSWLWLLVFGIVFAALGVYIIYLTMAASYVPVHRYFNATTGDHFYNLSKASYTGYRYEGIAFYALPKSAVNSGVAIYQFYNKQTGNHRYEKRGFSASGYVSDGVVFRAYASAVSGSIPVYLYWNSRTSDSLYERTKTTYAGYTYDKIVFYARSGSGILPLSTTNSPEPAYVTKTSATSSTVTSSSTTTVTPNNPVYRFYSAALGSHFYSTSATEGTNAGYVFEGVAYYAYAAQVTGTTPVYRFYNATKGSHFYSTSATEGTNAGYVFEGVAYYAYAAQVTGTTPVYRFYNATKGSHFYSTSATEGTNAGYTYEGAAFYAMSAYTGTAPVVSPPVSSVSSDLSRAQTALQGYINKCPSYLTGATVTFGDAAVGNNVAIVFYTSKHIAINPNWDAMTASSLETIVNHEVWHIIDFALDSKIDWGENIPPATTAWPACMR